MFSSLLSCKRTRLFCHLWVKHTEKKWWWGEGNGNPLQCSCLENPRDGGAWWAAVSGVAQSRTWLKRLSSSSSSNPGGSVGNNLHADASDEGSRSRLRRSHGKANGNPLQYSCLENRMDRRAWWATVHGVAKSQTWLSGWTITPTTGWLNIKLTRPFFLFSMWNTRF